MIKLLIADDSALMRKLLGGIFSAEGDFDIRFARNGREALELAKSFQPDVVTLDVHMPEMNGLDCLDRIMVETPRPVVMLSALTEEGAEETLQALRERYCIVVVTHNLQQAARVSNVTGFMYLGELVEIGPSSEIFTAPRNRKTDDYITGRFG